MSAGWAPVCTRTARTGLCPHGKDVVLTTPTGYGDRRAVRRGRVVPVSMSAPAADDGSDALPRRARWVAYGLVALLALSVVAQVEWWPLSSFRLFSQARTGTATSWRIALVDAEGAEHPLPFDQLPRGFRGSHHLAPTLRGLRPDRRDAVCRAWADAARDRLGIVAAQVRVYRVTGRVPTGHGPTPTATRTLSVACAGAGT